MNQNLLNNLKEEFPTLYKDIEYIECKDGWYDLIYELSKNLYAEILKEDPEVRDIFSAVKIKEKFGALRFYTIHSSPKMKKLIIAAENKSSDICEVCGSDSANYIEDKTYFRTRCFEHENT